MTSYCKHPLPEKKELTNREVYGWLSEYQSSLELCNNKLESLREFFKKESQEGE